MFIIPLFHSFTTDSIFSTSTPKVDILKKFSIIIPTHHERIEFLEKLLKGIFRKDCDFLDCVYIYWNDFKKEFYIPAELTSLTQKYGNKVTIYDTIHRDLNSRFIVHDDIKTNIVLSIDDDMNLDIDEIEKAFKEIIKNNLDNMIVGTYDRRCDMSNYNYVPGKSFNMILTGLSFLNINHLIAYNNEKYSNQRSLVSKLNNCEDILMNFIISNEFKTKPIYIKINHTLQDNKGISSNSNHHSKRVSCCRTFMNQFGPNILQVGSTV